jgi:hypothetical protein
VNRPAKSATIEIDGRTVALERQMVADRLTFKVNFIVRLHGTAQLLP